MKKNLYDSACYLGLGCKFFFFSFFCVQLFTPAFCAEVRVVLRKVDHSKTNANENNAYIPEHCEAEPAQSRICDDRNRDREEERNAHPDGS